MALVLRLLLFLVRFLPCTAAVPGSAGLGLDSAPVPVSGAVLEPAPVHALPPLLLLLGAAHEWVEWGVNVDGWRDGGAECPLPLADACWHLQQQLLLLLLWPSSGVGALLPMAASGFGPVLLLWPLVLQNSAALLPGL